MRNTKTTPNAAVALATYAKAALAVELPSVDEDSGASLVDDTAFFLLSDSGTDLGKALFWAKRHSVKALHAFAPSSCAGDYARKASYFAALPFTVTIWAFNATDVSVAQSCAIVPPPTLPQAMWDLALPHASDEVSVIQSYDRLILDYKGLEIGRVITHEGELHLDVGVGQADRELQLMLNPKRPIAESVAAVVEAVAKVRNSDVVASHPLARINRQGWLRSHLAANPQRIGMTDPVILSTMSPRDTVLTDLPAAMTMTSLDGQPHMVVCSVGASLDVVANAADYRHWHAPKSKLLIVSPKKDSYFIASWLTDALPGCHTIGVDTPWHD